uniref:TonB-dependent receptor n=2 Tax=Roseivirga sp. TaxID=1964215 RepID=UPI004047F3BF
MVKKASYISLLLIVQLMAFSQKGNIIGKVSFGQQPIESVTLAIKGQPHGAVTNAEGDFRINELAVGKHQLVASFIGFRNVVLDIEVMVGQTVEVLIELVEDERLLDEVVVSGTMKEVSKLESPVSVEVYSGTFFKSNPAPSVFESMQNVNGVRPQLNCNVCNTGDIHINGLEGPYTMVLIDGMPIVSGLSTVYGLTGIPQAMIDRVEVVKGPASTLYGSEAVGGLINLITKKPKNSPAFFADSFVSSWGEINTDVGARLKAGNSIDGLLGINYFNYQNPIDNNGDGFTDVTLQDRFSIFNKWSFDRKENRVFSLAGRYVYEDRWGGDMNWATDFRGGDQIYGESIYTSRWEVFGVYQLPVKEHVEFQFSANNHIQNSVYGNLSYLADQFVGFGQLTLNKRVAKNDLLLGLAYRYTTYDDNTPATASIDLRNQPSITHLPGVFVQNQYEISTQNQLLMGLRYDYNSRHGSIFSPRLNYKWNSADRNNVLRLSIGNGYRVANVFTEDHAALSGGREVLFVEELRPETSWNANLNFVKKIMTRQNAFIDIDFSAFYTRFQNRIIADYDTNPNQIIYDNLDGHAISRGASLNLDFSFLSGLKILAGATYQEVFTVEDNIEISQLLTERFSGVWTISYAFPISGLKIDYTGNVYGPMRLPVLGDLDPRASESPWWSLQNIQLTMPVGQRLEVYGGVKNLLNFTPPANSIARPFDPFDRQVEFDSNGQVVATPQNPYALTFDPSYVFAPNQGIRGFFGLRLELK